MNHTELQWKQCHITDMIDNRISPHTRCKSLVDIKYNGTMEQWKKIKVDACENESLTTNVIHCTDGDASM